MEKTVSTMAEPASRLPKRRPIAVRMGISAFFSVWLKVMTRLGMPRERDVRM